MSSNLFHPRVGICESSGFLWMAEQEHELWSDDGACLQGEQHEALSSAHWMNRLLSCRHSDTQCWASALRYIMIVGVCWQVLVQGNEILSVKEKSAEVAVADDFCLVGNADVSAFVLVCVGQRGEQVWYVWFAGREKYLSYGRSKWKSKPGHHYLPWLFVYMFIRSILKYL